MAGLEIQDPNEFIQKTLEQKEKQEQEMLEKNFNNFKSNLENNPEQIKKMSDDGEKNLEKYLENNKEDAIRAYHIIDEIIKTNDNLNKREKKSLTAIQELIIDIYARDDILNREEEEVEENETSQAEIESSEVSFDDIENKDIKYLIVKIGDIYKLKDDSGYKIIPNEQKTYNEIATRGVRYTINGLEDDGYEVEFLKDDSDYITEIIIKEPEVEAEEENKEEGNEIEKTEENANETNEQVEENENKTENSEEDVDSDGTEETDNKEEVLEEETELNEEDLKEEKKEKPKQEEKKYKENNEDLEKLPEDVQKIIQKFEEIQEDNININEKEKKLLDGLTILLKNGKINKFQEYIYAYTQTTSKYENPFDGVIGEETKNVVDVLIEKINSNKLTDAIDEIGEGLENIFNI
ncbi:MAG TPA: hypothetical protein VJ892_00825 [Candidatus Absconditabacterales bacterium]|nr:hypothetical protein [Candidatus Absconditabacterales bacterium]